MSINLREKQNSYHWQERDLDGFEGFDVVLTLRPCSRRVVRAKAELRPGRLTIVDHEEQMPSTGSMFDIRTEQ